VVADEHGGEEGNERLVRLVARHGVACIDAPVLGTKQPAEHCQLVVLASGPRVSGSGASPSLGRWSARPYGSRRRGGQSAQARIEQLDRGPPGARRDRRVRQGDGSGPQKFLDTIEGGPLRLPYP
jgi:3-hydroxyisobutyrate dehydrogenase